MDSNVFSKIRNKIAFHSGDYDLYRTGFDRLPGDADCRVYLQHRSQQYFQYADAGLTYVLAELTGKQPLCSLTYIVRESLRLSRLVMAFIEECVGRILQDNFDEKDFSPENVDLGEARPFDTIAIPCFTATALQTDPRLMPLTVHLPPPP